MKILYLISSLHYGGAEKQTIIDANLMSYNNEVFLGYFNDGPQKKIINSKVKIIKFNKTNYLFTALELAKFVKKNKIDIIHASLFAPMIISSLSTLFFSVKIIWHFHSHEYDVPWYSKSALMICARMLNVKKILFVSNELKNYNSARFLLPKSKLNVIYNSSSFQITKNNYNINSKPIIGFVGRLVELKRVDLLIELADYLIKNNFRDYEIWIIGDGEERNRLENCVREKKLEEFVKFYGFQKNTKEYYNKFSIFILPSIEECLSIALIDAGIAGIPSIAFDVGGNNEIVYDGVTGFIVKSKDELFEKTILLLKDQELRRSFSKNSIIFSANKFSIETRKRNLIKLYEDVIKN